MPSLFTSGSRKAVVGTMVKHATELDAQGLPVRLLVAIHPDDVRVKSVGLSFNRQEATELLQWLQVKLAISNEAEILEMKKGRKAPAAGEAGGEKSRA